MEELEPAKRGGLSFLRSQSRVTALPPSGMPGLMGGVNFQDSGGAYDVGMRYVKRRGICYLVP